MSKLQMTSKERMKAYFSGECVDRLPYFLFLGDTAGPYFGVPVREYYWNPEAMVAVEMQVLDTFECDNTDIIVGLRGVAEALGSQLIYPENDIHYLKKPILENYEQLEVMKKVNPYTDGRIPVLLEAMKLFQKRAGDRIDIGLDIGGPISAAGAIRGYEQLLRDFAKRPDQVHQLLQFATECTLEVIRVFYNEFGVTPGIADPMASASLISKKVFKEFAMPYLQQYARGIKQITGNSASLHICGRTKPFWQEISQLEFSTFSVDNVEDLGEAVATLGKTKCIIGNVDPVNTIRGGTVQEVLEACRDCYKKAGSSPNGYILAPGCQIPADCPKENLLAMKQAACEGRGAAPSPSVDELC